MKKQNKDKVVTPKLTHYQKNALDNQPFGCLAIFLALFLLFIFVLVWLK